MNNYDTIERAIIYISENAKDQPGLDDVAHHVGLSPFHFQRLFKEWAGVSPKKFLEFISVEQAKTLLRENRSTLDTSLEVGLSGTSRLHDLFVTIEGLTPGDFKSGAKDLVINYSFADTPFGRTIVASTDRGICYLAFCDSEESGFSDLMRRFPNATFVSKINTFQHQALDVFNDAGKLADIKLHLKGTPFQLKIWAALLRLPAGTLATYSQIAESIGHPKAVRAVGTAVGANPVAFLIPCHRVIRATGIIGDYRWGSARKKAILGWEATQNHID